jgi:hypothetical protein
MHGLEQKISNIPDDFRNPGITISVFWRNAHIRFTLTNPARVNPTQADPNGP